MLFYLANNIIDCEKEFFLTNNRSFKAPGRPAEISPTGVLIFHKFTDGNAILAKFDAFHLDN